MAACVASLLYVPLLASVWPLIKLEFGPSWLFITLALAFLSDTVAYIFGRLWGRHKLYPAVSPGKTVEGAVGGLVGGVLATVVGGSLLLLPDLPLKHALVLGVVGSLVGQVGDLFESMLKRGYGVKDSSALLGAHGGMLDRVDALLFVAPVVYYYARLVVLQDVAEALRQRSHDDEVIKLVNSINESVDALEGLFSELLDITRIDTGDAAGFPVNRIDR